MLGVVTPVLYTFVAFLIYSLGNFKLSNQMALVASVMQNAHVDLFEDFFISLLKVLVIVL